MGILERILDKIGNLGTGRPLRKPPIGGPTGVFGTDETVVEVDHDQTERSEHPHEIANDRPETKVDKSKKIRRVF